jgi:hypothetical protein
VLEARYAELEAADEDKRRARMRRQPLLLIGLTAALVLGIGVVASVDLRRLETPGGVGLRWTQAAVFGDCADYFDFSVADAGTVDDRPRSQVCRDLREAPKDARANNLQIGLRVDRVATSGRTAVVGLVLTRLEQQKPLELQLLRVDGQWKVLRDGRTCGSVGCA